MNLTTYDECEKTLDFQPEKPWPNSWPSFAWEGKLISGFIPSWSGNNTLQNLSSPESKKETTKKPVLAPAFTRTGVAGIKNQVSHSRESGNLVLAEAEIKPNEYNSCKNLLVLNFSSKDVNFLHLFHTCHPHLNFSELGRILLRWSDREKPICSWKEFFSLYDFHQNTELLIQQLKVFTSTPMSFQNWVNKKAAHLSELRVLNSLEDIKQAYFIFEWLAEQSPSHSQGIKILELGVELLLMNLKPDKILKPHLSPEKAIQEMEKKRKPLSSSQDQMNKSNLKKIIWPPHVTGQWQRKGDTTGLEIKIWCRNQKELEEKTNRVNQLSVFNQLDH